jgi:S-(hydroxymethyl)glutathione dehydrogenase/alcohol dehydrogenase
MKAAVLYEVNKPLVIEDVSLQKPGPREVLIRTSVAGLCHSDLHFMEGLYPHPLPAVLGHESAGVVEQVGSDVTTSSPAIMSSPACRCSAAPATIAPPVARCCAPTPP